MIHEDCRDRILQIQLNPPNLVGLFNKLSDEAEANGLPAATVAAVFYDENCNLKEGDWAAELHLVVRKVSDEREDDRPELPEGVELIDEDDEPVEYGGCTERFGDDIGRDFNGPGINPEGYPDPEAEADG
jgi:hypothetical protein